MNIALKFARVFLLGISYVLNLTIFFILCSLVIQNNWSIVVAITITTGLVGLAFTSLGEQYFRAINRMRVPTPKEASYVQPILDEVLSRVPKIKTSPELFIIDDPSLNACAAGTKTLAINTGLLNVATSEEIAGVLSHEVGHLLNGDTKILLVAAVMNAIGTLSAWVITLLITVLAFIMEVTRGFAGIGVIISLSLILEVWFLKALAWIVYKILDISFNAVGRQQEYAADRFAAQIGFREGLFKFLMRMHKSEQTQAIKSPLLARINASHPQLQKRLDALIAG